MFTVRAKPVGAGYWHLTVDELPATWTVAFERSDVEARARARIALDLGLHRDDFDIAIIWPGGEPH